VTGRQVSARQLAARMLADMLPRMPFNSLLGMRLKRTHADGVTVECPVRDFMRNGSGVLHGGVAATLADAAAGIATNYLLAGAKKITTVEMKVNYFKPVASGRVQARAHVERLGSTLSVSHVEIFNGPKNLVGSALVTYMILGDR
jgi:uncharacterized protein (TIGR00369 family)